MPLSTPIVQLIDRDPISVELTQKISEAVRILSGGVFHHLPVVDKKRLVGILSSSDLLKLEVACLKNGDAGLLDVLDRNYCIGDIMVKNVIPLSERATVGDAAKLLSMGGFHALPVTALNGNLIGIVTTTDLISHMLEAPRGGVLPKEIEERLQTLEKVYEAARNYLLSGMAISEHEQLERVVEEARRTAA